LPVLLENGPQSSLYLLEYKPENSLKTNRILEIDIAQGDLIAIYLSDPIQSDYGKMKTGKKTKSPGLSRSFSYQSRNMKCVNR